MSSRFSPYVISALIEVITGGPGAGPNMREPIGKYRSGPEIERFFLDCNLDMKIGASSRIPATTEFLRQTATGADGDQKIKNVLLKICDPREYIQDPDKTAAVRNYVNEALEGDGLAVIVVNGVARLASRKSRGVSVEPLISKAAVLDFDTVQAEIARAIANCESDPEDAVTAACSLIESVCRSILVERGVSLPNKKDVGTLVRAVQSELSLSPSRDDLPADVANDARQVLSGLTSVAMGIGALRTHVGDAHGREKGYGRIDARIARFALNSGCALALFLIETWERIEHRSLPTHKGYNTG
jgi:Abortive infection C-terminus